jgi:hypothetical protein
VSEVTVSLRAVCLYALLPALAGIAGATVAAVRPPGARFRSMIQHLGAPMIDSSGPGTGDLWTPPARDTISSSLEVKAGEIIMADSTTLSIIISAPR